MNPEYSKMNHGQQDANVDKHPLRWLPMAYNRSLRAPINQIIDGKKELLKGEPNPPPPPEQLKPKCNACEKVLLEDNPKRCSRCKVVFYCSKECQVKDWTKGGHKKLCKKQASTIGTKQASTISTKQNASSGLVDYRGDGVMWKLPHDKKKWVSFDWNYPEVGTPLPEARAGFGTLYLQWDGVTNPMDIPLITEAAEKFKVNLTGHAGDLEEKNKKGKVFDLLKMAEGMMSSFPRSDPPGFFMIDAGNGYKKYPYSEEIKKQQRKTYPPMASLKSNKIYSNNELFCNALKKDSWYGHVLKINSESKKGLKILRWIKKKSVPGKASLIIHSEIVKEVDKKKNLYAKIITGLGHQVPPENRSKLMFPTMSEDLKKYGLTTHFHLYKHDKEVARIHVSYKDGSHNSVIGPTVEMMETLKECQGNKYLKKLFRVLEEFYFTNWRFNRVGGKFADGNIFGQGKTACILKATYMQGANVEKKKINNKVSKNVTDKKLLSGMGWIIREIVKEDTNSPMVAMNASQRDRDEEWMKFITEKNITSSSGKKSNYEKIFYCENCTCSSPKKSEAPYKKCEKCECVMYCSVACQRKDWPFHKLWCGKTSDEILKKCVKLKYYEATDSTITNCVSSIISNTNSVNISDAYESHIYDCIKVPEEHRPSAHTRSKLRERAKKGY